VGTTRTDLWVAVSGDTSPYVTAVVPPNSTKASSSATLVATPSTSWHGIDPVRLLDTRTGNGLSGKFVDDKVRTVTLAGRGGIPADAIAVTANLTITGASSAGYVSIGPSMTAKPSTSSINVGKGQPLANGLTLKLGPGGAASAVFKGSSGTSAHVVLDVTGYSRDDSGATWYPLSPTRLLDTRSGNGLSGSFRAGTVRSFQVGGRGSVPTDAIAVTGNLTATGGTASGYVSLGPSMTSSPSTSTLNLARGKTVANNVTVRLGSGDKLSAVYVAAADARIHLVFDVTGYYRAGSGGARWYAIDPVRLLDTRVPNGLSGKFKDDIVRTVQLASRGTMPVDALALTGNFTVTGPSSAGYMSIGPSMSSKPATSTINFAKGQTLANGVAIRLATGGKASAVFKGSSGSTTHALLDVTGYFR
jgi:hypothetical protein